MLTVLQGCWQNYIFSMLFTNKDKKGMQEVWARREASAAQKYKPITHLKFV